MTESAIRAGSHGIGNTLTGIEEIVKIDVNVTDLEPDDGSKWSAIGWKSPVALEDIVTITHGCVDRSRVNGGNLSSIRFWIAATRSAWLLRGSCLFPPNLLSTKARTASSMDL